MVMIEAMACGLPVVAFDFKCGPKDIIEKDTNGLIVPEGDITALAEAMIQVMADDAKRKAMAIEARKVTERYSEERVMGQWITLFKQLTQ
jgi:glycosyltransferase involved in cell wall biosynthesis